MIELRFGNLQQDDFAIGVGDIGIIDPYLKLRYAQQRIKTRGIILRQGGVVAHEESSVVVIVGMKGHAQQASLVEAAHQRNHARGEVDEGGL